MIYVKVHGESPFVIVCDGRYQEQLAYQRLDRDPFSYAKITTTYEGHGLQELTLPAFLRLHA